jgi:hypothetical protein
MFSRFGDMEKKITARRAAEYRQITIGRGIPIRNRADFERTTKGLSSYPSLAE